MELTLSGCVILPKYLQRFSFCFKNFQKNILNSNAKLNKVLWKILGFLNARMKEWEGRERE